MSEITLYNAVKSFGLKHHLTSYQQKACETFFSYIKVGDYIYAGQLKSKLVIDLQESYEFLEELRKQGFLQQIYEIYCSNCGKHKGKILSSISEFNPEFHCDYCGTHLNPVDNLIVLYKVVRI